MKAIARPAQSGVSKMAIAVLASIMILLIAGWSNAFGQGQPTTVNPTASSVNEQKLLDALKPGTDQSSIRGRVSIPDQGSGKLIQPAGRDWVGSQQGFMPKVGAVLILGMLALLAVFFLMRGRIPVSSGFSGRMVQRFGSFERFAHWLVAISFIALGLTGLNLTFGKSLLLPVIGPEAFASLAQAGKFVHNYVSFAFVVGLVLMLLVWIKDNIPHPRDITWFAKGGGLVGSEHPPAGRFNGGQKLLFWLVLGVGAAISYTGFLLMFPFQFADLAGLQWAGWMHGLLSIILIAVIIGHIYIGTLGMQGAFSAMGTGEVDENWAREHHSVWAEQVIGKTERAAKAPTPAE